MAGQTSTQKNVQVSFSNPVRVSSQGLLDVISAIYHITEAEKIVVDYDTKVYELLEQAKEYLIQYIVEQYKVVRNE